MANVYTNYKAILSTSALTTLYTVGSETTAIIKSIRVSNTDEANHCKIYRCNNPKNKNNGIIDHKNIF